MSGDHFGAYGDPPSSSELATRRAIRESEQLAEQLKLTIAENERLYQSMKHCDAVIMQRDELIERLRAEIANLREAMEKQAKIGVAAMNNAIKLSDAELASAQRLRRESSPDALESERAANAQLTEELERAQAEIKRLNECAGNHRQRRPSTAAKLEAAEKRLVDLRNGFKLCIGLKNGVPWTEVKDSEVDAYVQRVLDFGKAGKEVVDVGR